MRTTCCCRLRICAARHHPKPGASPRATKPQCSTSSSRNFLRKSTSTDYADYLRNLCNLRMQLCGRISCHFAIIPARISMFAKVQKALLGLALLAAFSPITARADDEISIDVPAGAQLKV